MRCLICVGVGIRWRFYPMKFTVIPNLSSVEVWVSPVNSLLRVLVKHCSLLFVLFVERTWYLKSCLGWWKTWLSSLSGLWQRSGKGSLEFSSSVWYGTSVGIIAPRKETDSSSRNSWENFGYGWTVSEVSIPDEGLSVFGKSEREEVRFSEEDELECVCYRSNAEIELSVDLVLKGDDVCIDLDLI